MQVQSVNDYVFFNGKSNVHDVAIRETPSLVSDDLLNRMNEKIRLHRDFTLSELSDHLPDISRSLAHERKKN